MERGGGGEEAANLSKANLHKAGARTKKASVRQAEWDKQQHTDWSHGENIELGWMGERNKVCQMNGKKREKKDGRILV